MALGTQVVDLVGLHLLDDAGEVAGVAQVAVVQLEAGVVNVRVLVDVVHPLGVERAGAALDAVHDVAFSSRNSARYEPSWPVMPVMRATLGVMGVGGLGLAWCCCYK
jgi:hypothetical protein